MSTAELGVPVEAVSHASTRLLVSRQDEGGMYQPVGFLDAVETDEGTQYSFAYLQRVADGRSFRPLLGFTHARRYTSLGLFPLFAERLMDPRRPDHPDFLAALDLSSDAAPLTILARSAGHREGDGIELTPVPVADAVGRTRCIFLVHGVRHIEGADERIGELVAEQSLVLRPQPDNPHNRAALHVAARQEEGPLGWVPNVLLDYAHAVRQPMLTVVRVNGPAVGPRLRLLVELSGTTEPGWGPFSGPEWQVAD